MRSLAVLPFPFPAAASAASGGLFPRRSQPSVRSNRGDGGAMTSSIALALSGHPRGLTPSSATSLS